MVSQTGHGNSPQGAAAVDQRRRGAERSGLVIQEEADPGRLGIRHGGDQRISAVGVEGGIEDEEALLLTLPDLHLFCRLRFGLTSLGRPGNSLV